MKRREVIAALGTLAVSGLATAADGAANTPQQAKPKQRTLLRIDSSSRTKGSYSRQLADTVEQDWKAKYPSGRVVVRDFVKQPIPHVQNGAIEGFYLEPRQFDAATKKAMAYSDVLAKELVAADDLLLSVPIYNFTVPSTLKAWLDQVVRLDYAFQYSADGNVKPLLTGKRAYVAMAYGFEYTGTELAAYDFLKPYLQGILGYVGITDVKFVAVEGTALGDAAKLEQNMRKAQTVARQLVA